MPWVEVSLDAAEWQERAGDLYFQDDYVLIDYTVDRFWTAGAAAGGDWVEA